MGDAAPADLLGIGGGLPQESGGLGQGAGLGSGVSEAGVWNLKAKGDRFAYVVDFSGSVIVALTTPVNGQQVAGTITNATALSLGLSFPSLIALMRTGDVYVNVHTTNNPAGEIRGQLQAAS